MREIRSIILNQNFDHLRDTAIAIFGHTRSSHLQSCLDAVLSSTKQAQLDIFIFIDGPRNSDEILKVQKVISVANNYSNLGHINVQVSDINKGLAASLTGGITEVFEKYSRVIVLEDDIVIGPAFMNFMLQGLEKFHDCPEVASIHGYCPPITLENQVPFFLKGADCWGWATWKDRWECANFDSRSLLAEINLKDAAYEFDFDGNYPYTQMLKDQILGRVDSWAIRWHASNFLDNKFTLYPPKSLVTNTGFDGSGTHSGGADQAFITDRHEDFFNFDEIEIRESLEARKAFIEFFKANVLSKPGIFAKFFSRFKKKLSKFYGELW